MMRNFQHTRSTCRSFYSISHRRQNPQSLSKTHFPHTPKGEERGRSTLQSPSVSSQQAQWHHPEKPIAITDHPSVPARLHKQHQYEPYEHHRQQSPAFHTREQGPRATRYAARHSGAGLYACTHQLHITALSISAANSALWIPTGCRCSHHLAALNLISLLITVTTYKKASPWGGPTRYTRQTSLALMTSLAQKLTMLLLGHACTTLLDDRSHDGPPIDRSLQLRVNRIVSYNFFPTLGRARASQGDNLKKFSRLSASHHSGNCW